MERDGRINFMDFHVSVTFYEICWLCSYYQMLHGALEFVSPQVHHGGAGTTAAGLKAAVSNWLPGKVLVSSSLQFFPLLILCASCHLNSVPNDCCSFLWRPTILGWEGSCQGIRSCTHPCRGVLTREVNQCHTFHAGSCGMFIPLSYYFLQTIDSSVTWT